VNVGIALSETGRQCSWLFRIAMFNQFLGINAILYYLNDIFARAGFRRKPMIIRLYWYSCMPGGSLFFLDRPE